MIRTNKANINTLGHWNDFYKEHSAESLQKRVKFYSAILPYINEALSLLDVGCGSGYGLAHLRGLFPWMNLTGIDISPVAIEQAKKLYTNINFEVLDCRYNHIKLYEYITILQTLEHLDEPKKIIDICLRRCRNLIITVPNNSVRKPDHVIRFTENSFDSYNVLEKKLIFSKQNILVVLKGKL